MDTKDINAFLLLARTGSMTKTAFMLGCSKSKLSKVLASLEKKMGVKLFVRNNNSLELTTEGQYFLESAKKITTLEDAYRKIVHNNHSEPNDHLIIGAEQLIAAYRIPNEIASFQTVNKEIPIKVREYSDNSDLFTAMAEKKIQLAFIRNLKNMDSSYDKILYYKDSAKIIVSKKDIFSSRQSISLSELRDRVFYLMPEKTNIYKIFMDYCAKEEFMPRIGGIYSQADFILNLVSMGMGVTFLLDLPSRRYRISDDVAFINCIPECIANVYLVRLKNVVLSPSAQKFWDYMADGKNNIDEGSK